MCIDYRAKYVDNKNQVPLPIIDEVCHQLPLLTGHKLHRYPDLKSIFGNYFDCGKVQILSYNRLTVSISDSIIVTFKDSFPYSVCTIRIPGNTIRNEGRT